MVVALIMCAGGGERVGLGYNKLLYKTGGRALIEYTLKPFLQARSEGVLSHIVMACAEGDKAAFGEIAAREDVLLCGGGTERSESVYRGLGFIAAEVADGARSDDTGADIVLVCDGARPNTPLWLIKDCIESARRHGSGIAAVDLADTTARRTEGGGADGTAGGLRGGGTLAPERIERRGAVCLQTPQAFRFEELLGAYRLVFGSGVKRLRLNTDGVDGLEGNGFARFTDDSGVYSAAGFTAHLVWGSTANYKVTTAEDLRRFEAETAAREGGLCILRGLRIGLGQDCHRLDAGRRLMLGGVHIPCECGAVGHSDGDALLHAVIDALLACAGLPDIGRQFPDSDARYKDISGMELLSRAAELAGAAGAARFRVASVSAVVTLDAPKLNPFFAEMKRNIADALGVSEAQVSLSAKTTEGIYPAAVFCSAIMMAMRED